MTLQCCACHGTRPGTCDCACHDHDDCKREIERLQAELASVNYDNGLLLRRCKEELEPELEQAKAQQIHCLACGGVECHRLAEIVQLTGVESDQHLVEWVEQAKERFALLKAGYKIEVSRSLDFEKQFKQAKERLIETTGKAAEYDAALEALSGTDERLPLFGRIMQLRTEAKERERQLWETLTQIEAISDPATGVQNEEAWASIHQLAEAALTVPPAKEKP